MNYPQVSIETAPEELNRLHTEIEAKMRSTVQDAIRAGEILERVKTQIGHGGFLVWVKLHCQFSERTARNYMAVYEYRNKTASVADLQEAYKQVETLEAQARMSQEQQAKLRIAEFSKTGQKPEGWRRGTDDKLAQEEAKKKAWVKEAQADLLKQHEKRVENLPPKVDIDDAFKALKEVSTMLATRAEFKERIRVSHEGKDDPFVDAIIDYLDTLADDNRRVEACYNIIKVCKGIANQLQRSEA